MFEAWSVHIQSQAAFEDRATKWFTLRNEKLWTQPCVMRKYDPECIKFGLKMILNSYHLVQLGFFHRCDWVPNKHSWKISQSVRQNRYIWYRKTHCLSSGLLLDIISNNQHISKCHDYPTITMSAHVHAHAMSSHCISYRLYREGMIKVAPELHQQITSTTSKSRIEKGKSLADCHAPLMDDATKGAVNLIRQATFFFIGSCFSSSVFPQSGFHSSSVSKKHLLHCHSVTFKANNSLS